MPKRFMTLLTKRFTTLSQTKKKYPIFLAKIVSTPEPINPPPERASINKRPEKHKRQNITKA